MMTDEEYHAMRNQDAVWRELKSVESDEQCDWVSGIIALGENRAKCSSGRCILTCRNTADALTVTVEAYDE